jgi:hypothetical protein
MKDILQGESLWLRWFGHVERMENQRMPKLIATDTMEGIRKRGRPRKRRRGEVEEGLNVMGMRNRHAMARDRGEWWKILLEAKVQNGL